MKTFEVFLTKEELEKEDWELFRKTISEFQGLWKKWYLLITIEKNSIHFYIKATKDLPTILPNLNVFLLKKCEEIKIPDTKYTIPTFHRKESLIEYIDYFFFKKQEEIKIISFSFKKNLWKNIFPVYFYLKKEKQFFKKRIFSSYFPILKINKNQRFFFKKAPKYLDIEKIIPLLTPNSEKALLKVDTFPYLQENTYLQQSEYSFYKHSFILGSSGTGKSKFISSFLYQMFQNKHNQENYKVIVIDPHASLIKDIGGLANNIDFNDHTINLFDNDNNDLIIKTELILELLKSLIHDQCNSKVERVLRHSIYLLLSANQFQFQNLKKILLDLEYRNSLLQKKQDIPNTIIDFFMNDFHDLKTKSYGESISPIISFLDEMEMLPSLYYNQSKEDIQSTIQNHFLTIFSLDRMKLGDKITKTLSGLILEQLLTYVQSRKEKEQILVFLDEVSIIETPILSKLLSEARKYNLSLFLCSQYFNQISPSLKDSVFANTINYYLFRISKTDAEIFSDHLSMKIPSDNSKEAKVNLLTNLNHRECLVRIEANDTLLPIFKAKTLDYESIPYQKIKNENIIKKESKEKEFIFSADTNISLKEILATHSSNKGGKKYE